MKKINELLKNPYKILFGILFRTKRINKKVPDSIYLKLAYRSVFGKKLNLKNPRTFNEKLQWLKINDRHQDYVVMVDKYNVKNYISQKIGSEYVIPNIGIYEKFEDIDFNLLPDQFVLKTTHDSGGVVICQDKFKFDKAKAKLKLDNSLANNFFYMGREWPYKNVKPQILVEEYKIDSQTKDLKDYKFFTFNGKVKCFKIDFDRFDNHRANYYDEDGKLLKFGEETYPPDFSKSIKMPRNLKLMISLAEKLSTGIPFLRVDFYEIDGKVFFGELTFYPASGFGKFIPEEWDLLLGDWLTLPSNLENK